MEADLILPETEIWFSRPIESEDLHYVRSVYWQDYTWAIEHSDSGVPKACTTDAMAIMWERWMREASGMVAISREDPTLIISWALFEPAHRALHYVHTRKRMRKLGVGGAIVKAIVADWQYPAYTHDTEPWQRFLEHAGLDMHHDPYRAILSPSQYEAKHDRNQSATNETRSGASA